MLKLSNTKGYQKLRSINDVVAEKFKLTGVGSVT